MDIVGGNGFDDFRDSFLDSGGVFYQMAELIFHDELPVFARDSVLFTAGQDELIALTQRLCLFHDGRNKIVNNGRVGMAQDRFRHGQKFAGLRIADLNGNTIFCPTGSTVFAERNLVNVYFILLRQEFFNSVFVIQSGIGIGNGDGGGLVAFRFGISLAVIRC